MTDIKVHFEAQLADKDLFISLLKRVVEEYGQFDIPQGSQFPPHALPCLLNFGGQKAIEKNRDGARPYLVNGTYQGDDYIAKLKKKHDRPAWMEVASDNRGSVERMAMPLTRAVTTYKDAQIDLILGEGEENVDEERELLQNFYHEISENVTQPFLSTLNPSLLNETKALSPWLRIVIETMARALFMGDSDDFSLIKTEFYGNNYLRKPEDKLRVMKT